MWRTLFYRFPRLVALTIMMIVAGGLAAFMTLGRQEDPTLVERYGQIVTLFPGADAERVEARITEPIERALLELPEIDEFNSESRANVSRVSIKLREDLSPGEVDEAWTLIRQQAEQARADFPAGVSTPDVQRQYIGASTMIVAVTWTEDGPPPLAIMNRMADSLEERLGNLQGTEETQLYGGVAEEIRIEFDTMALSAAGLSLNQAAALIASADSKNPAGELDSDLGRLNLEVDGSFESIARIRAVPLIQRPDGSTLRVGDIAEVRKTQLEPARQMAFDNNRRTVQLAAFIEPGLRVDLWAERARAVVNEFASTAPRGIDIEILFDQSVYTNERLGGLAKNMAAASLIVFAVLFVFMGWRAAIVVGSALPLTICLVLILFNIFDMPLHQMSVTGLIIALGLLIDNAIVVADEYEQKRRKGIDRVAAIDQSLKHLSGPLFASTLTTALAFAPIALQPGSTGEFIGMIGVSVIFSVCGSLLIAIFVVPALAAFLDRPLAKRAENETKRWWRDGLAIDLVSDGYRWTLDLMLRFKLLGIVLGILPAAFGIWLVASGALPQQFFPQTERNQFQVEMILPPQSSIAETIDATSRATDIILAKEGITRVNWTIGQGAPRVYYNVFNNQSNNPSYAAGWVEAEDAATVRRLVSEIQAEVRQVFPDAQFLALPFEQGPPVQAPILFRFTGPNLEELDRLGDETRRILAQVPGITYTRAGLQMGAPTLVLQADEIAAQLANERLTGLASTLAAQLDGVPAGSILEGVEELPVRVTAARSDQMTVSSLRSMMLPGRDGGLGTPLSAFGDITLEPKTASITRRNGERVNVIYANLDPYTLPAPAFAEFLARFEESGVEIPPVYDFSAGGEAESRGDAISGLATTALPLLIAMAGAVTLVFNSFRVALIILSTGLLSICVAFVGVWLFGLPMGFNAIVGGLGLFGISINGAIVVLSALMANPEAMAGDRLARRETIVDATRHIVATTLTTMGGFVPIILTGDMFWMPLATSIAVGVAGSAILALYFAPALFLLKTGSKSPQSRSSAPPAAELAPAE